MPHKIILAGGSGFVGEALTRTLAAGGRRQIIVLTRNPDSPRSAKLKGSNVRLVKWDGKTAEATWQRELEDADALINLSGRSVNCVHDAKNRAEILRSRVDSVQALGAAIAQCAHPPKTWIQCSAVGYYGNRGLQSCDEQASNGNTFLAEVCRQWEDAFAQACPKEVRPIVLRLAMVLGREGGALPPLAKVARGGLGGHAGHGDQGMSWVHIADLTAMVELLLDDVALRGTFNACAPEPVSNREFMRTLREMVRRPWSPPAPAFVIKAVAPLIMRTDPSLVLEGQYCLPAAFERAGFEFRFPDLQEALTDLLRT